VVLVFTISLSAQKMKPIDCGCKSDTVKMYYENIFKAEHFLIEGKNDSAFISYLNGMSFMYFMHKDYYPNIYTLLKNTENPNFIYQYYSTVFKYTPDSVTPSAFFDRIKDNVPVEIQNRLLAELPSIKKTPTLLKSKDYRELSSILAPLAETDQDYRGPSAGTDKSTKKNRKNVDVENFKIILKCYKKYGSFNTMRLDGDAKSAFRMVLLHRFCDKKTRIKYSDFFLNEVLCGHIDSRDYASIVDNYIFDSTQVYGIHSIFFIGDSLFVFDLSNSYKQKINQNRKQIYLEDIDVTHQKQIWQWQHFDKYLFEIVWEIIPYDDSQKNLDLANDYLKKMGSMVTGYTVFTR
jgi:hypothetical protein